MDRPALILLLILLLLTAGCSSATLHEQPAPTTVPAIATGTPITILTTIPATPSPAPTAVPTTMRTATPIPTPTPISEAALNARIVDARNRLNNFIDSDVADTVITHPDSTQGCEVKKSRELGYLIDADTGESTFIKGDYWSIDASLFSNPMRKDHEYIIIHTHPRMWTTCRANSIASLYTFSIGDLEATAKLTGQGYHVKTLIAISDKEYRIAPRIANNWKSSAEIRQAVNRIEGRMGIQFTYYDPVLEHEFFDVDNLMPYLAKELNYRYSVNNNVIS
jgi:hypothetical protein